MRVKAVKRSNPYIEEGVLYKPKINTSPYEATLERLLKSPKIEREPFKPISLKYCKHCIFKIKLSSNGAAPQNDEYPIATLSCKNCSADICLNCSRICNRCEINVCFVCSNTLFEDHETLTVCPDCN